MSTATIPSYVSLAKAMSILQASDSRIQETAEALQIVPAMRWNGATIYAEQDIDRIGDKLRELQGGR